MPSEGPNASHEGSMCLGTVLAGNYPGNSNTRFIRVNPFVIPDSIQHPRLRFWHWFSFSDGDFGKVQIREIYSSEWTDLSSVFQNNSSIWSQYIVTDFLNFYGKTVQIGFLFHSDWAFTFLFFARHR